VDETAGTEVPTDEVTPDGGLGYQEPEVESTPTTETEAQRLDIGQYGDHVVTLKVGGEDVELPLRDAISQGMMQQDYTRKTQELASQREELAYAERLVQALESDPERALQALAQAYEVQFGDAEPQEPLDPEEARWQQVESFMQAQYEAQQQADLDLTLNQMRTSYGDFDENELLSYAIEHHIANLDDAFKAMSYDSIVGPAKTAQAQREAQQRKETAPPVAGGHGVAPGAVTPGGGPPGSVREAFAQAKAQHGAR
jgi:hypothetical protein